MGLYGVVFIARYCVLISGLFSLISCFFVWLDVVVSSVVRFVRMIPMWTGPPVVRDLSPENGARLLGESPVLALSWRPPSLSIVLILPFFWMTSLF